ncbi:MAG: hypothetical protein ABJE95_26575 [Byssovorax sp.]
MAFGSEARASCAGPVSCVCDFRAEDMVAAFTGKIIQGEGNAFSSDATALKVRIDEITIVEGKATQLVVGSVVDAKVFLTVGVKPGDSILGFSELTCAEPTQGCPNQPLDHEAIDVRAVFNSAGLLACNTTPTGLSPADARALLIDPDCEASLVAKTHTKPPELACHDTGCLLSVAGGRTPDGAAVAVGFLALVGAWRLRRARR